jgi:DNA-binding XRE family transcriptional regulator
VFLLDSEQVVLFGVERMGVAFEHQFLIKFLILKDKYSHYNMIFKYYIDDISWIHYKITLEYDFACFYLSKYLISPQNHIIMTTSEIGKQIKERRKVLRITQPDLAEMADISINTLYKIERGQANPTVEILNKIADILGMELKLEIKQPKL